MSDSQPAQPLTYAERLGGGARVQAAAAQRAAEKAARQAEASANIDRRNAIAGTLAERLEAPKARDERIAAEKAAIKQAEQARIAKKLGDAADDEQAAKGQTYAERISENTLTPTKISTKDLRAPSERQRDAAAKRAREIERDYDDFGAA